MTYAVGQPIAASDYMAFRGAEAPNVAFPNASAATDAVAALVGVGYGSRGYGQTSITLPSVATGDLITAGPWNNLFSAMAVINTQTGSGLTLPVDVVAGDIIQADNGSSGRPNLPLLISTLDSNRLLYSISQMAVSSELTSTRTTTWNTSIVHQWVLAFTSEDSARYFFNTGGQVYASGSRTGGSATHINVALTTLLAQMGTIKLGALTTTYTGSGGTSYPIGYYGLTGTFQTVFIHYGSAYGYTAASYTLQARVETVTGVNGGNGSIVRMQAIFATGINSYGTVDGTLTSNVQQLKADVLTVASPTYATTISLSS